jgi:hypothetical protein
MTITPKAIQDLLDELEASKQSRLRAWNVLQRLRSVLSELGNIAIPAPAQKTFDAEGEILEHALTRSFRIRNEAIKSLCSSVRRFRDATIKEECHDHVRTIQTNDFGRRTCSPLSYRDSTATDLPISWNIAPTHTRMPVILPEELHDAWLSGEAGKEVLVPCPADRMKAWPVDARVNSPKNNDPEIIMPSVIESIGRPESSPELF